MTMTIEEAARLGIKVASQFSIASCTDPACGCSGLFIQMIDDQGQVFAIAPFSPGLVDTLIRNLLQAAQTVADAQARAKEDLPFQDPDAAAPFTKSILH